MSFVQDRKIINSWWTVTPNRRELGPKKIKLEQNDIKVRTRGD
jgi:hypothetical protein